MNWPERKPRHGIAGAANAARRAGTIASFGRGNAGAIRGAAIRTGLSPDEPAAPKETWGDAGAYERWVGRWSRRIAHHFVDWLAVPPGRIWSDVGCGTGAVTERIVQRTDPERVVGLDRSGIFIAAARNRTHDPRVQFQIGDACATGWNAGTCDVTVAGLVLNFVPDADAMVREMTRITAPLGRVATYVWDYTGGMEMIRHFWDVALELNPEDSNADRAKRFALCRPRPLLELFSRAGLTSISIRPIDIAIVFDDFDDYWMPFLGRQGIAPAYLASLSPIARDRIRDQLRARLTPAGDGPIAMLARAWAVQGTVSSCPAP
jgi:trans-aconitate methyltransferase